MRISIANPLWLITVVLLLALIVAGPAVAQESLPSDDEVNAIAKGLYCPVCENIPLDVCPTQACVQWRELIREKLTEGWDERQIKDYFVLQYGDRVLAEPPRSGLNWLAYVVPPLALLAGGFILYRAFAAWRAPVQTLQPESPASPADDYVSRLEEELARRDWPPT